MAIFVAAAGTAFQADNFGAYQPVSEGPVQQIEGAVNWATAALDSLRLFQTLWFDGNGDGVITPHDGDFLMGRVDYDVILPVPQATAEGGVAYGGTTTARFTDLQAHAYVGTLTLAPYAVTISAFASGGFTSYAVSFFNPVLGLFGGDDTVTLGDLADNFYDPDGALLITLGGGDDTLTALGGGADTVHGGAGNDLIGYQGYGNLIFGDDGDDVVRNLGAAENDFTATTLDGGAGDDSLQGGFGDDLFVEGAGSGDDVLDGSSGLDMVDYSAAAAAVVVDMSLFGPERVVPDFYTGTATGGSGNDYLVNVENATGSAFDDIFLGDFGSNVLLGNGGDDRLTGGFGADRLDGGTGRDTADYAQARGGVTINLITGTGNRGEATGDVLIGIENVTGGLGGDRITGDAQGNVLDGGAGGSDNLNGMEGDDFLFGHARTDRLAGGLGDDRLDGGAGADALLGGLGNDHFIFTEMRDSTPGERDVIVDFGQALGDCDRIDLRVLDAVPVTELQNEAFVLTGHHGGARFTHMAGELRLVLTAGGTEVRLDINGDGDSDMEILVKGVQDLTGHDFLL